MNTEPKTIKKFGTFGGVFTPTLLTILGPGDFFPIGSVVVTYEVLDASGNSAQCSFDVIVQKKISASVETRDVTCPGNSDGSATIAVDN